MNNVILSQLICTRISHDLIGNAGALSNALELMEDDDMEFWSDIKKIISASSSVLSARMRFFRLTFGLDNTALFDNKTVFSAINDYLKTLGNMTNVYDFAAENTLPEHNRAILLSVMILADFTLKGGEIKTCYENENLWVAISTEKGFSEDKIAAVKAIISGSDNYNTDAQYAHIMCLKELLGQKGRINLIQNEKETVVFQIKF